MTSSSDAPPSHYDVLGIQQYQLREASLSRSTEASSSASPTKVAIAAATTRNATGTTASALLRRAYRRALLRHHPDKKRAAGGGGGGAGSSGGASGGWTAGHCAFSIDQITEAWSVLSDPVRRRAYDAALAAARKGIGAAGGYGTGSGNGDDNNNDTGATGLEIVDLDDLAYDAATQHWFRGCRCGNERGFVFAEADLEEALRGSADDAAKDEDGTMLPLPQVPPPPSTQGGELLVGCQDCSLWLCVHFAAVDDDGV